MSRRKGPTPEHTLARDLARSTDVDGGRNWLSSNPRTAPLFQSLFAGCVLFLSACSQPESPFTAEEGGVRTTLSTNRVLIGDVFRAEVEIDHPSSAIATLPSVDNGDTLTVLSRQVDTRNIDDTRSSTRFVYELQSFVIGIHDLTTNAVAIKDGDQTEQAPLPDLPIEVISVLEQENETLADLKDPVLWPRTSEQRLLWALLAVMGLALLAGLIALYVRRSKTPKEAPPVPVIPAHELALKALRDLKAEPWLEKGEFERYYVKLSDIVRHYLENRFDLHAPEQTTEEFIREASSHSALNPRQKETVQAFLLQSDLVKFARFTPSTSEADAAYDSAIHLVEETKPSGLVDAAMQAPPEVVA